MGNGIVLHELRVMFGATEDEELKGQINVLERAFRAPNLTSAVKKELNAIRRNSMVGEKLFNALARLYQQHNIREWLDRRTEATEQPNYQDHL